MQHKSLYYMYVHTCDIYVAQHICVSYIDIIVYMIDHIDHIHVYAIIILNMHYLL